jgi:serine phosphatase RsbU (regulator of sigma subunit)/tetratricopeptide (TPR) repeat protein
MKSNYHYFLVSLICVVLSLHTIAQTPTIDSLKRLLVSQPGEDTLRANTLIALSNAYDWEMNDMKRLEKSTKELLTISLKLDFKKGIATAYRYKGKISTSKSDLKTSIHFYRKALEIFESTQDKAGIASCYHSIGVDNYIKGDYETAIDYALKAAKLREEIGDKRGMASSYNNIGISYAYLGNYLQSLRYNFNALKIREEIDDKFGISASYLNIGGVLFEQNKYNAALAYFNKALKIKIEQGDKTGEAGIYNNIAEIYSIQREYQQSLAYNLKAMKLNEQIGDLEGVNGSFINIGNNYIAQQKPAEALDYFIRSLKISTRLGTQATVVNSYMGIAACYELMNNYPKSLIYYEKAAAVSKNKGFKKELQDAYLHLSSINEKLTNYQGALMYNKLYANTKDTLLNEESLKQTTELNTRYETEKKEKEILLLTKDQQLKDKTLKEQRLVRSGLIIGLGLFLVLSFLLFNRYRFKQKANLILEKQKQEIHQKNRQITDSIDYAKTIQEAILPDDEKLRSAFPEYFILYKPKAIVSGDFYWIGKKDDKIICAVADCTGHGVPGAFMSLLGHNILENVIQQDRAVDPGSILTALNEEIVTRFSKSKERETVKQGMDIALISIDDTRQQLQYAGARNSLYLVRKQMLTELKADRMSTGVEARDHTEVRYNTKHSNLQTGDMLYMFSDGFPDQKGGADKKKFFYQPFKELLISISNLPVEEQKQKLDTVMMNWIGTAEQIDDILVMGIRIT